MISQIKESEKKTWNLINLLNNQIANIEKQITEVSQIKRVSTITLEKYSNIDRQIEDLELENEKYDKLGALTDDCKTKTKKLSEDTMVQVAKLEKILNN